MELEFIEQLVRRDETSKIVLLVLDGVGGLPDPQTGKTELERAETPHLDALASSGICGLQTPVGPGITPGSGPGHLSLFGYDPLAYRVGRGVLSALGVGFDLQRGDVAARGNFCTLDADGVVRDRRAGRISTELNEELCERLRGIELDGAEVIVETVKGHRLLLVLRGAGLSDAITDTDPQETGERPVTCEATDDEDAAERTAALVRTFVEEARAALADCEPANGVIFRGFAQKPDWPTFEQAFGLRALAVANYPMYRGVARLVGMDALDRSGSASERIDFVAEHWEDYDFFFVHEKRTDSRGEDGDAEAKIAAIEDFDAHLPDLLALEPDVVLVTGDHSTPAAMAYHSWHPVPTVLWSEVCRTDGVESYGERACLGGGLGARLPGYQLMPLALANANRLGKFGA